jgi:AraC-like DNA-binding protein
MFKYRQTTLKLLRLKGVHKPKADAFAFSDSYPNRVYYEHSHQYHQLIYSFSGIIRLETKNGFWLLPPQRAAWIPAGVRHRTEWRHASLGTVNFRADKFDFRGMTDIEVFSATPLLRELVLYAMRWPNLPRTGDLFAASFFQSVAHYCRELAKTELPFRLPQGKSKKIRAAIEFTVANLENIRFDEVATAAGCSKRSLTRHFHAETGLVWRDFLTRVRLLHAVELLSEGKFNVTEAAFACGFTNLSAFSKAFQGFVGKNPAKFRQDCLSASMPPKFKR